MMQERYGRISWLRDTDSHHTTVLTQVTGDSVVLILSIHSGDIPVGFYGDMPDEWAVHAAYTLFTLKAQLSSIRPSFVSFPSFSESGIKNTKDSLQSCLWWFGAAN